MTHLPVAQPGELAHLLGHSMTGVTRVVLEHWRCQRFRPIAILEYTLGFMCVLCLLPLIIIAALTMDSDIALPNIRTRFYRRWHELRLLLLNADGAVVGSTGSVPADAEQGYAAVASVLAAAAREQVVVIETLNEGTSREIAEVWYGGRPLMAHPEAVNEERATILLQYAGISISKNGDSLTIIEEIPPLTGLMRVIGWLVLVIVVPILPFMLLMDKGRRTLRHLWHDIRTNEPRGRIVVRVRAESMLTYRERPDERWDEQLIDGTELIGITLSPMLGFDENVTRQPASLRLIGRRHSSSLPLVQARKAERALRDLLIAATLRLRGERPELGLIGIKTTTRCPFCAALFVMDPGSRCPSCGAFSGTTP